MNTNSWTISFLILTGGKSSRFGSDKSAILFEGKSLLQRLFDALPEGEIIVVGPDVKPQTRSVTCVLEVPRGGGPVAGLAAGLELVASEYVALLATDIPFAAEILPLLPVPIEEGRDGVVPLDASGRRQMLCAIYRTEALRAAIMVLGDPFGQSMKSVINQLNLAELTFDKETQSKLLDIDTPQDLEIALEIRNREMEEMGKK